VTDDELRAALDGLCAYDEGAVSSGIHDEQLRQRCIAELKQRTAGDEGRAWLARFARDMYLSDEAIGDGYGLGDVLEFAEWLRDEMGVDL